MTIARYSKEINAPKSKVYHIMLDKPTYEMWTSAFNPTSTFKGTWDKGSKICFVGSDKEGEMEGMVSEIVENIPGKIVSIRHYGILKGGEEITHGPEVDKWANAKETYKFYEEKGITTVMVEMETSEEMKNFLDS